MFARLTLALRAPESAWQTGSVFGQVELRRDSNLKEHRQCVAVAPKRAPAAVERVPASKRSFDEILAIQ